MRGARFRFEDIYFLSWRARILLAIPVLALIAAALWIAAQFLQPIPPRHVVFAVGPDHSAFYALGERYRAILAHEGITLELRATQGAGENLRLLQDPKSRVDIALLGAGMASSSTHGLVNVSNLFYGPLWGLCRCKDNYSDLTELRGKRVALGLAEGGLALLVEPLLAANGVTPENTTLLHLPEPEALKQFRAGDIDVVFSGEGALSKAFMEAVSQPSIEIMNLVRAEAYARRFPYITRLELPAGSLDFAHNIPARRASMIGTTVMLVARETLHPTVVDMLVDAARQIHSGPGYFERRGEFPNIAQVDVIPASQQAVLYSHAGASFLRRYVPLWLADFLQRIFALAIPILAVAFPLVRLVPSAVGHVLRDRIRQRYAELRRIELEWVEENRPYEEVVRDLDELAINVGRMHMPVGYADDLFALRRNIAMVRDMVAKRGGSG